MKVNQNISAVISNAQLHRTENNLSSSIERLASGYKINKAKDNPAGIAISNKMRAQIEGLSQSSRNAADGASVIQTADGALNETHAMLQRMRELSVQAATDTLTTSDKEACQEEIEALKKEIDRIATDTEFNGKRILDGSQDRRIFPSTKDDKGVDQLAGTYIKNFQTSDEVSAQNYSYEITAAPEQAKLEDYSITSDATEDITYEINGVAVEVKAGATDDEIYAELRDAAELAGVKVEPANDPNDGTYNLTTIEYGSKAKIAIKITKGETITEYPAPGDDPIKGVDAEINMDFDDPDNPGDKIRYGFQKTATYLSDGKKITITDLNGFQMIFEIDPENAKDYTTDPATKILENNAAGTLDKKIQIDLEVTDIGSMTLQVGAHEDQIIDMRIPPVDCANLYIADLNVVRKEGADEALNALDDAIAQVSAVRSRLGAYQNRLDYAVTSLDGTVENMESAISRIMDTDMAEEMSVYSNQNVLDQAAISVLTQANDMPQQVLQLLN